MAITAKDKINLSRAQRRANDRINQEVSTKLNTLIEKFYNFFMENTPDSPEVLAKQKELSAKWKMLCHQVKLKPEALELFDKEAQKIIDAYQKQLKES